MSETNNKKDKSRILRQYIFFLTAGVILLFFWWRANLSKQTVASEWVVESMQEKSFIATSDRTMIQSIGLCNDNAVKDVFDTYETCFITGTARIADKEGNLIWKKELSEQAIATYRVEPLSGLLEEDIVLVEGETYYLSLVDEFGNEIGNITWSFYGEEKNCLGLFLALSIGLILLLTILYFQYNGFIHIPFVLLWIFLLIGASFLSMLAMAPPCVADEELHFGSAYALSNQILQMIPGCRQLSVQVPSGVLRMIGFGDVQYLSHFWTDWTYGNEILTSAGDYYLAGSMPHYSYIVPAIGITFMRLIHAPYQFYIIAARLMNVLLYAGITLLAIRICPKLKPAVIAVTFVPSSLWLINSCSYDVWNLAFCILLVCYCKKLGDADRVRILDLFLALVILIAFLPIKFIYFNFALMILFVSRKNLAVRNQKVFFGSIAAVIVACVAVVFIARGDEVLAFLGAGGFDERAGLTMETKYTLGWVLQHPFRTVLVYIKTLYTSGSDIVIKVLLGDNYMAGIPAILTIAIAGLFFISLSGTFGWEKNAVSRKECAVSWLVILSGIFIVMSSFMFVYTYKGGGIDVITGLQGRYFIPFLICLVFIVPASKWAARYLQKAQYLLIACSLFSVLTRFGGALHGIM